MNKHGIVTGYVRGEGDRIGSKWELVTAQGAVMGTMVVTAKWPTPLSYTSTHMFAVNATIDGVEYYGRTGGPSLSVVLRPRKK